LLQLGQLEQLQMYGTASSGKHDVVRALGATPIDYRSEDFLSRVLSLTGDGVDAAFDPIGGTHLGESYRAVRKGGTLVAYGVSSAVKSGMRTALATLLRVGLYKLIPDGKSCRFYGIHDQAAIQQDLARLLGLLERGSIKPLVGAKLPLTQIDKAHALMDTAGVVGKVVIVPE
jgi:NADPH:quinone reductase-like Zn-dependent oxidoreductase